MADSGVGFLDKRQAALSLIEDVTMVTVTNAQEHTAVGEKVNAIRAMEKELEAEYKAHPVIVEAKKLQAIKGKLATALEDARKSAKDKMMKWEDAEEEKRQAEERRIQAEQQAKAEEEALAAAVQAEKEGDKEAAAAIINEPIVAPTVVIQKSVPKVAGHSRRMVKRFRLKDPAGKGVKAEYLSPDMVKIGSVVRALGKASEAVVGGIEYYEDAA